MTVFEMLQLFMILVSTFVSWPVNGFNEITLTTAIIRPSTSAKPTTLIKKIYNYSDYSNQKNMELFTRRSASKLWDWDLWCQMQPKTGNCSKNVEKYYYKADSDQCLTFRYSGCKGNKNNFDTKAQCEGRCKGATLMILRDSAPITFCSLQVNAGYCMGLIKRYYYDINEGTCKGFTYGGCGGNQNNFETRKMCLLECQIGSDEDLSYK